MKVTFNQSTFSKLGLELGDLVPLDENCTGFMRSLIRDKFVYTLPLHNCGSQIVVSRFSIGINLDYCVALYVCIQKTIIRIFS